MRKIILICVLMTTLLLIACSTVEETAPEETVAEEQAEVIEEVIEETIIQEPSTEILSALKCADNKIEAVLTNTNSEPVEIAKTMKVMINGLLVVDPECDSLTLAAGESTFCSDLSGHLTVREGKTNTVKINVLHESAVDYVECFVEE